MVLVDDAATEAIGICIGDWFEAGFTHRFQELKTISVPDSVKPIPRRWVEDVEIGMDEGFAGEEADVLGEGPTTSWTPEESKQRLRDSLNRLGLREDSVAQLDLSRMSRHDLSTEKRRVKHELKRFDSDFRRCFRRLPSHVEKEPMRPLYVHYRRLKTMITHVEQARAGVRRGSSQINSDDEGSGAGLRFGPRESPPSIPDYDEPPLTVQRDGTGSVKDQMAALEARIDSLQGEKASVRGKLQAFQERFVVENNRKIRFHKDILPIEREYRLYKNLKEEIQKAESQVRELRLQMRGDRHGGHAED